LGKSNRLVLNIVLLLGIGMVGGVLLWWALTSYFCKKRVNVILISIDTCRADHLGCYGYKGDITPNIDAVAEQGYLFFNTLSPVPLTLPSHCSMMTGTIPPHHGVRDNMDYKLGASAITLAEVLAKEDFETCGIVSSFVLDSKFGLSQGFHSYNDSFKEEHKFLEISERRGQEVTKLGKEWLEANYEKPFFMFLHYFDPHTDYRAPEPFASKFRDSPYAAEVAYADYCVGGVIEKLKELGIYDSSLVVIVGDHGEGLGEHRENEHSFFIYQSTLHVPLIVKLPDQKSGARLDSQAAVVDVMPTILGCLGISAELEMHGEDLCVYFDADGSEYDRRDVYCESLYPTKYGCNPLYGIVRDGWKYIWTSESELYNLRSDPEEVNNVISVEAELARDLRQRVRRILAQQQRVGQSDNVLGLDAASRARLTSLGYVEGRVEESIEINLDKPDAKLFIDFHRLSRKYTLHMDRGQFQEAMKVCAEMASQYEDVSQVQYLWGNAAFSEGKMEEAASHLTVYVEATEGDPMGHYRLGLALARLARHEEAVQHFGKALELDADDYMVHGNMGLSLNDLGRFAEAQMHFREVLRLHPDDGDAHANLGASLAMQKKFAEAIVNYKQALELKSSDWVVHGNLGKALLQTKKIDEAIIHWKESIRLNENQPQLQSGLGQLLAERGQVEEAIGYLRKSVDMGVKNYTVFYNLGFLLYGQGDIKGAIEQWERVLEIKPDDLRTLNNLAWALATCATEKLRDGHRALRLAEKMCELSGYEDPAHLDTLAACYASGGDFQKAVEAARKAIGLAKASGLLEMEKKIKVRLRLYESKETYIDIEGVER
jgi:arylsulfatase A-like enzyme/Flp pilus assembly protein TadD